MLNSLIFGMKQECYIKKTAQDFKINFVSGSAAFNLSSLVSGGTSGATGTVKTVTVLSGAWESGTAAGNLVLSFISGTFQNGEEITDAGTIPGQALISGVQEGITDSFGAPITTSINTYSVCSFDEEGGTSSISKQDGGAYIVRVPLLFLPAEAEVTEGDYIIGNSARFLKTYLVTKVIHPTGLINDDVDHVEALLELYEKKQS